MDNIAHAAFGLGIYGVWAASAQPHVHGAVATAACVAAIAGSEAPDGDILCRLFGGPVVYLRQHRMYSHSMPLWFLYALVIGGITSLFTGGHFWLLFALALAGVVVHVAADVLTTYGTLALWPLSQKRYAINMFAAVEPIFIAIGLLAVILVQSGMPIGTATQIGWGLAALYTLLRAIICWRLTMRLAHRRQMGCRASVVPQVLPWWWGYVVEGIDFMEMGRFSHDGAIPEVYIRKSEKSPAFTHAIRDTEVGRDFRRFARHFVWQETVTGDGIRITMADAMVRFGYTLPFGAVVVLREDVDGRFALVTEAIRGQTVDLHALVDDLKDTSPVVEDRVYIPQPKRQP